MRDWLPERPRYLEILLDLEVPPNFDCAHCGLQDSRWRCEDCQGSPIYCDQCILQQHRLNPFHRIQVWKQNSHFRPAALWQTGLTLHVGHRGSPCPCYRNSDLSSPHPLHEDEDEDEPDMEAATDQEALHSASGGLHLDDLVPPTGRDSNGNPWLVFVHTTGVHYLPVQFCLCQSHPRHHIQLLQAGLYPATVKRPRTAFTFNVLDDFYLENLECKTAARNYYSKLKRQTSNLFPHLVTVCTSCDLLVTSS